MCVLFPLLGEGENNTQQCIYYMNVHMLIRVKGERVKVKVLIGD